MSPKNFSFNTTVEKEIIEMYLSPSELKQLDLLMGKSPLERFLLMAQLIGEQIEVIKAGIKYKNPGIDNKELYKCLKSRMREIYSWKH